LTGWPHKNLKANKKMSLPLYSLVACYVGCSISLKGQAWVFSMVFFLSDSNGLGREARLFASTSWLLLSHKVVSVFIL